MGIEQSEKVVFCSSEEVVEEAVVDEGVIVDENITATEDPSQTAEQIVESGRRASDRNAPARCANGGTCPHSLFCVTD